MKLNINKIFKKHQFTLMLNGGIRGNTIHYSGTENLRETYSLPYGYGMLSYNFQTDKLRLFADFGGIWEQNSINGHKMDDAYPQRMQM